MNWGYSLLLGEHIGAALASYDDSKLFQIVCPACKEPVFKVKRDASPSPLHYFSHYDRDKAFDVHCDLRVNGLSAEALDEENRGSRGQRLAYFLSVLQNEVLAACYESTNKVDELCKRLKRSQALRKQRYLLLSEERTRLAKTDPNVYERELLSFLQDYLDDVAEIEGTFQHTIFSAEVQKRIASDIWQHLLSAKATDNFNFLFNHGFIILVNRIEETTKTRELHDFERLMFAAMEQLIMADEKRGDEIRARLLQVPIGPPFAIAGYNLYSKLVSEIHHEMFGILVGLPYFEILQRAQLARLSSAPI